jgi:hypothetical protein
MLGKFSYLLLLDYEENILPKGKFSFSFWFLNSLITVGVTY